MQKRVLIISDHQDYWWFNREVGASFPYIETVEWIDGTDAYVVDLAGVKDSKTEMEVAYGRALVLADCAEIIEA